MKHVFAVDSAEKLRQYQQFVSEIQPELDDYIHFLSNEYAATDLPRAIVWTDSTTATSLISDIPIPAYTNEFRVVMCPEPDSWREVYLKQLDGLPESPARQALQDYYSSLSYHHVMQILGHELAHHSQWFLDEFSSDTSNGIWFEEGMAEYISRRYFLTEEEFNAEAHYNQQLVTMLNGVYGGHSLEDFGAATYEGDYASIFFEYWRSFLAVNRLVDAHGGNVRAVFAAYHHWARSGSGQTLSDWFQIRD